MCILNLWPSLLWHKNKCQPEPKVKNRFLCFGNKRITCLLQPMLIYPTHFVTMISAGNAKSWGGSSNFRKIQQSLYIWEIGVKW